MAFKSSAQRKAVMAKISFNKRTKLTRAFIPREKGIPGENLFVKVEAVSPDMKFAIGRLKNDPLTLKANFNDRVLIKQVKKNQIPKIVSVGRKDATIPKKFKKV